jgi:carbonic anhydrase
VLLSCISPALSQESHSWGYSGATGPDHWYRVSATCGLGKTQSPIDILHAETKPLQAITFAYHSSPLKIINNEHTIQVNYAPGSSITVGDKTYELVQFHFHHLSETEINSQRSPMELHLVHQDKDGNLAVVAVLLNEGHSNPMLSTVWSQLPQQEGQEIAPEHVEINALNLLPANHRYYTFPGSLTTPPCSESVTWLVLATPTTLSKEQIAKFAAIYPNNARPVQPLNNRVVLESE